MDEEEAVNYSVITFFLLLSIVLALRVIEYDGVINEQVKQIDDCVFGRSLANRLLASCLLEKSEVVETEALQANYSAFDSHSVKTPMAESSPLSYASSCTPLPQQETTTDISLKLDSPASEECSALPEFLQLAQEFAASHTYSDQYNCQDYSRDLYRVYRDHSIDSKVVCGNFGQYGAAHCMVEVTLVIEPQTGEIQ